MKIQQQIDRIKKSEDGKVLAKNAMYLTILQFIIYLCPLITTPYLARVIGTDGFGKLAFALAIMVWIQTIADWGFNYTATRDVAKNRENKAYVSHVFSTVFWGRWILTALSFLVLVVLMMVVPKFQTHAVILLFSFIMIPGHILFPDWFFQALERMEFITIMNVIIRLVFTVAIFIFIRQPEDYIYQPLIMSMGYVLCGILSMYIIVRKWKIRVVPVPIREIMQYISNSTNIFINNLMPNLYNSFSYVLLNFASTDAYTGIYNAGRKLPDLANSMLSVIGRVFFPYLNRKSNNHRLYAYFSIGLSVLAALVLIAVARPLTVLFFGQAFEEAYIVLRICAVAIVFNTMNTVYGVNYLIINGKDALLRNMTIVSSLIGFALAFPLVKYFDYIGISVSYLTANILMGVLPMVCAIQIEKKKKIYGDINH